MAKKTLTFEDKLKRIEEIVELLDSGEIPLDDMLKIYEEGIQLTKSLKEYLEKAEIKIVEIGK